MFSIFVTVIFCYLLVRFIFGFVIPVVAASNKVRKKMRNMHGFNNPDDTVQNQQSQYTSAKSSKPSKSDYIDYEEIK